VAVESTHIHCSKRFDAGCTQPLVQYDFVCNGQLRKKVRSGCACPPLSKWNPNHIPLVSCHLHMFGFCIAGAENRGRVLLCKAGNISQEISLLSPDVHFSFHMLPLCPRILPPTYSPLPSSGGPQGSESHPCLGGCLSVCLTEGTSKGCALVS
jgi:hypothetical protein